MHYSLQNVSQIIINLTSLLDTTWHLNGTLSKCEMEALGLSQDRLIWRKKKLSEGPSYLRIHQHEKHLNIRQ